MSRITPRRLVLATIIAATPLASGCAAWWGEPPKPPPELSAPAQPGALSVDMSVSAIAANPQGRQVLDRDLPGLLQRPEYPMFKGMTLKALAAASNGKISTATLEKVQQDLQNIHP